MPKKITIVAHNIRSIYNVGSIFRTSEGFGVEKVIFSGYTPYPTLSGDTRLPHISNRITKQIHKTALGAEEMVAYEHQADPSQAINDLRSQGYAIVGLELDKHSIPLSEYQPPEKIALILGEEVRGLTQSLRHTCDALLEIPMHGKKESFNVSVATGIALYALTLRGGA
jgi:tRNA G18 (ribose-2'-O)-methylase SpoU